MTPPDHRLGIRSSMLRVGEQALPTAHGELRLHFFRDLVRDRTALAIDCGDTQSAAPMLARVHSSCLTSECLMARDCDCAEQLAGALETMAYEGRGVLFYLMQEGRGAGLTAKARDRMIVQASENRVTTFEAYAEMGLPADLRRYDEVASMGRLLGVRAPLRLLTNNPDKATDVATALADAKIEVCGTEPIQAPTSPFNSDYLVAKHDSGHALDRLEPMTAALPPESVSLFDPQPLPGQVERLLTASYFLPVSLAGTGASVEEAAQVDWFRLSVVFDAATTRESILLSMQGVGEGDALEPLTHVDEHVTMSLFDRLPTPRATGRRALRRALRAVRERGRGAVAVDFDDGVAVARDATRSGPPAADERGDGR